MRKRTTGDTSDQPTDGEATPIAEGTSRRNFLKSGALGLAAVAVTPGTPAAPVFSASPDAKEVVRHVDRKRKVLRGGAVLSLDPAVGDFERGDVVIEGKKIVSIGPSSGGGGGGDNDGDNEVIDCSGTIVMPGFITTHNHQYEALQRSIIADGFIVFAKGPGQPNPDEALWPHEGYTSVVQNIWTAGRIPNPAAAGTFLWDLGRPSYDPEDCYISELVACLSQITQGITMGTDTSQASHSPEYTDAMIQGLIDSGRRTLYDYSNGTNRGLSEFPGAIGDSTKGIGRLAKTYFNSKDQLVTLGFSGGPTQLAGTTYTGWQLGREFGAHLNAHNVGAPQTIFTADGDARNGKDWSDVTQVHCVRWQDNAIAQTGTKDAGYPNSSKSRAWEIFADRGGHASIAVAIEQQMQHGMPPMQMALNHGVLPSLSPDVDTNMTPDPFSLMRSAFCIQRALSNDLWFTLSNPGNLPVPQAVTTRQVIEMATIAGAAGSGVLNKVGTLKPGKEADIVVLDARNINVAPLNNVPGAVVTLMDTRHVRDVLIAGKVMVRNGKLLGWNLDKLVRDINRARDRVLARINGPATGAIPAGNNSFSNPYRPAYLTSCCYKGQNSSAPNYVLRP